MAEFLNAVLFIAAVEAVLAFLFVVIVRRKHRRTTGAPRFAKSASRSYRNILAPLFVALIAYTVVFGGPHLVLGLALLFASFSVLVVQPHAGDEVFGVSGVQRGWLSRRFEDIEEWRLTGDHLRFRVRETWLAVGLPSSAHAETRELLEQRCPGRESRFNR